MRLYDKSPVTLYYQVERQIRKQIENGELNAGDFIPSEAELMETFNVSRITIRKALERLEEDGIIIKKRGSKSIVSNHVSRNRESVIGLDDFRRMEDEMRQNGQERKATIEEHITIKPVESIAKVFGITEDEKLIRIRRLCRSKESPIWIESRYFRLEIGEQLDIAKLENESVHTVLQMAGHTVDHVEVQVRAVGANQTQAKLLGVSENYPLLLHESVSYSSTGEALQLSRVYLRSDYYSLVIFAKPQDGIAGLDIIGGGYRVKGDHEEKGAAR